MKSKVTQKLIVDSKLTANKGGWGARAPAPHRSASFKNDPLNIRIERAHGEVTPAV